MYGAVLGTSVTVGVAGVAVLPSTGSTRPLFIAAAVLLVGGMVALGVSAFLTLKQRANQA